MSMKMNQNRKLNDQNKPLSDQNEKYKEQSIIIITKNGASKLFLLANPIVQPHSTTNECLWVGLG